MTLRALLPMLLLAGSVRASLITDIRLTGASVSEVTETYSSSIPAVIPDNDSNGIVQTLTVPTGILSLSEVTVTLDTTGGWNGDLYAYLWHDSVISLLVNRPGRTGANPAGHAGGGMALNLADAAAVDVHLELGPLTEDFQPDGRNVDPLVSLDTTPRNAMLAVFNGLPSAGEWRLYIADVASGGTATLQSWSITLTGTVVPEPSSFVLLGLGVAWLVRKRFAI